MNYLEAEVELAALLAMPLDSAYRGVPFDRLVKRLKEERSLAGGASETRANTTMAAVERTGIRRVALGGGVAANSGLKRRMQEECDRLGIELTYPPPRLCTDNAAMIACAGYHRILRGDVSGLDLDTIASQPLTG